MKTILRLFTITWLMAASAASAGKAPGHPRKAPDHPTQVQPVVKMLEAVVTKKADLLRTVFSETRLKDLDAREDWNDLLKALQQQVHEFYGTTKLDLAAFRYQFLGNDKSGQVVFTYKRKWKDSIDAICHVLYDCRTVRSPL